MKVVYCGYRGTYGAFLLAAFHLGLYKEQDICNEKQAKKHFEICCLYGEQYGNLIYVGMDEELREIYVLGCKRYFSVIKNSQIYINRIFRLEENLCHLDVGRLEGIMPRIIGFLLARRGNRTICEKLFSYWLSRKYHIFSRKAREIKQNLKNSKMFIR